MKLSNNVLFTTGIIFSLWFSLIGMVWVYWLNIIFAYPFGIAAFFIWRNIKKDGMKRNKAIITILIIGLIASLSMLFFLK